jgi:hypothetical protein
MINDLFNGFFILLIGVLIIYINNIPPNIILKKKINPNSINLSPHNISVLNANTYYNNNKIKLKSILKNNNTKKQDNKICYSYTHIK